MDDFWNSRCILKVIAGSHAYGMNTETSDMDYRGICIPPASYLLGLNSFEQHETKEPDEVIYSLSKFVRLALQNNPNILDILFSDEKFIIYENSYGKRLRNIKHSFLSKRVFHTYGGYAHSRLKNLTQNGKNPIGTKKDIIEKYGWDTKDAAHLIRLMKMGIEILNDGEVNVYRLDRDQLLDIRNGKYSLGQIVDYYELLNEKLITAYEQSDLPEQPDFNLINNVLINLHKDSLNFINENERV